MKRWNICKALLFRVTMISLRRQSHPLLCPRLAEDEDDPLEPSQMRRHIHSSCEKRHMFILFLERFSELPPPLPPLKMTNPFGTSMLIIPQSRHQRSRAGYLHRRLRCTG
jgi:hypothetical protein